MSAGPSRTRRAGGPGAPGAPLLVASLVAALAAAPGCDGGGEDGAGGAGGEGGSPAGPLTFRLVTYNVGNADGQEPRYPLRLSYQAYEDHVGEQLRALSPDMVLLQEILPPQTCEAFEETDPARTCFDAASRPPAAQRLLGPDYTVVCDGRLHVECIGVSKAFGTVEGVAPGAFVLDGAETPPLPLPTCTWAAGDCDNAHCDAEATVSAVTVQTANGPLRVVHAHPNAPGSGPDGPYLGDGCRIPQLRQIFEGLPSGGGGPLVDAGPTVVAGDFNVDVERLATPEERELWESAIGEGLRFRDLSARDAATGETYPTNGNAFGVAIDHVVADASIAGRCEVRGTHPTVGPFSGTEPLDAGFDFSQVPGGEGFSGRIDHFALVCTLRLPAP